MSDAHPDCTVCRLKFCQCTGLPVNMPMPAHVCYISNTHISVTTENWTYDLTIFMTGNGFRNEILKYRY
jgi:hypothetical protein